MNLRKLIGHETLLTVGCGVIIEAKNRILLQQRTDDSWGIPGGLMELGETFEEAAKRETFEETGLIITNLELFGLYSGEKGYVHYMNNDKAFSVQIIFKTSNYTGKLIQQGIESKQHRFFLNTELPTNLNPRQKPFILDWKVNKKLPIIN